MHRPPYTYYKPSNSNTKWGIYIGIPIMKIERSHDHLIFITWFPTPRKDSLYCNRALVATHSNFIHQRHIVMELWTKLVVRDAFGEAVLATLFHSSHCEPSYLFSNSWTSCSCTTYTNTMFMHLKTCMATTSDYAWTSNYMPWCFGGCHHCSMIIILLAVKPLI